jgi:hypothetical protein
MAMFIGPPTNRKKSTQLKINRESLQRILGSVKSKTAFGPHGELSQATLNGEPGQILALESRPGTAFKTMVERLYQVGSYVIVEDSHYFFLLEPYFFYVTPKGGILLKELQQMQENAVKACDIEWDASK